MRRFYIDLQSMRVGENVALPASEAEHIEHSLRLKAGDSVRLFNRDQEFNAELVLVTKQEVRARITEVLQTQTREFELKLHQAFIRIPLFELVLQKATELGATIITPIHSALTQVKLPEHTGKMTRWERIVVEACKQSERSDVPQVGVPQEFADMLGSETADLKLLLTLPRQAGIEVASLNSIATEISTASSIALCVGPEGGLTTEEHRTAADAGWKLVSLGDFVLRSETAAIAGLAVVQSLRHA